MLQYNDTHGDDILCILQVLEIHNRVEKIPTCYTAKPNYSDYAVVHSRSSASQRPPSHQQQADQSAETLGTHEKTLLRELCNVSVLSLYIYIMME